MRGISKSFDSNPALTDADLDLASGEVLGIIGENGAGKSTLIRSLAGAHLIDSGEIEIEGQSVHLRSPAESIAAGVAVIYQELTIVPEMTIAENVFLGNLPRKGPVIDRSLMNDAGRDSAEAAWAEAASRQEGRRSGARLPANGRDRPGNQSECENLAHG